MATLTLVRHAQAASSGQHPDRDRPLVDAGRRDAAVAGRWLRSMSVQPHLAIVSTARRARETFEAMARELLAVPTVQPADEVYRASADELLELVRERASGPSVLVVGHNPTIAAVAERLDDGTSQVSELRRRHGYPTATVTVFAVPDDWTAVDEGAATLVAYTTARA